MKSKSSHPLRPSAFFGGDQHAVSSLHARRFFEALGREKLQAEFAQLLRHHVQAAHAPVVGAMQVTCSDEAEKECMDAFQREFVRYMLPSFKFSDRTAFRSANLGARYEWGAARIAEHHFALKRGAAWKLMVVKINGHVSVDDTPDGPRFGHLQRFDEDSAFCGAIHATLGGAKGPFVDELEGIFQGEGFDRLAVLRDAKAIDPELRTLFAAATSARLQARRTMIDLQDYAPHTPTLYLVLPCVSLNRRGHDTEILCGVYYCDRRGEEQHEEYCGLGDDPRRYELHVERDGLRLTDPDLTKPRAARDHRTLIREAWEEKVASREEHPRLVAGMQEISTRHDHKHLPHSKLALQALLVLLCELTPISAAMLLFGEGALHVHHASKAHRLAKEAADDAEAVAMLRELQAQVDDMEPERAQHLVTLLHEAYAK